MLGYPWREFFPQDFLDQTDELTAELTGFLIKIEARLLLENRPLPDEPSLWRAYLRIGARKWLLVREALLRSQHLRISEFRGRGCLTTDWSQMESERLSTQSALRREAGREGGLKSAEARRILQQNQQSMPTKRQPSAEAEKKDQKRPIGAPKGAPIGLNELHAKIWRRVAAEAGSHVAVSYISQAHVDAEARSLSPKTSTAFQRLNENLIVKRILGDFDVRLLSPHGTPVG